MGPNQVWDAFVASLPALKDAWLTVIGLMILAGVGGFGFSMLLSASAHSTKDERLKLAEARVADYKEKLEGASPDEAAARIESLEAKFKTLESGSYTIDQLTTLLAKLTGGATGHLFASTGQWMPRIVKVRIANSLGHSATLAGASWTALRSRMMARRVE